MGESEWVKVNGWKWMGESEWVKVNGWKWMGSSRIKKHLEPFSIFTLQVQLYVRQTNYKALAAFMSPATH